VSTHIKIDTSAVSDIEAFGAVARKFVSAARHGDALQLDLSHFAPSQHQHFRPFNLILLANLLVGNTDANQVEVVLPATDTGNLLVLRSGIIFALVNRPGAKMGNRLITVGGQPVDPVWLHRWSSAWTPIQPMLGSVFPQEPRLVKESALLSRPDNEKRATRVIIDPHLEPRAKLLSHAQNGMAGPWIRWVITGDNPANRKRRDIWLSGLTSKVLGEPLLNIVDHGLSRPSTATPLDRPVRSMVLFARTDGGGEKSHPRLQVMVSDTGYGAINTLRDKLPNRRYAHLKPDASAEEILHGIVMGKAETMNDPGVAWARSGFEVAVREGAPSDAQERGQHEFTMISGDGVADGEAVWVRVDPDGKPEVGRLPGVPFVGTTVFVTLPIPYGAGHGLDGQAPTDAGLLTTA
jgi:hypothetical protein